MASKIRIKDSYKVSKHRFESVLATYTDAQAMEVKAHRSLFSMKMEWASHNLLYSLGLFRSHTKDVDLDDPMKWWEKPVYPVVGLIAWLFIK